VKAAGFIPQAVQPQNRVQSVSGICKDKAVKKKNWKKMKEDTFLREAVVARSKCLRAIRDYFYRETFIEVETPAIVNYQCADPHIETPSVSIRDFAGKRHRLFLHASPEHSMKKLLVAGFEKIFQIAKVFRDREVSDTHNPEFTLLEWYRVGADYSALTRDARALVLSAADAVLGKTEINYQGKTCDLSGEWKTLTLAEAFRIYAGENLFSESADWEDWFFKTLAVEVEPNLGIGNPVFLIDYPRRLGTMARPKKDDPQILERVELYICGVELANGYSELTDPIEQRRRFEEAACRQGKRRKKVDTDLIRALEAGMPDCAGMAFGLDRLLMLLLDAPSINRVLPFNFASMTG
jgi:lysyl-tRNA synthetase class 2